mmetsp:Transcript_10677/g.19727  ORF Transcript_10677/g.19727 Transcript_10677/m.19727 type:complete len:99 (-) Transcript_10677:2178-2474(-)
MPCQTALSLVRSEISHFHSGALNIDVGQTSGIYESNARGRGPYCFVAKVSTGLVSLMDLLSVGDWRGSGGSKHRDLLDQQRGNILGTSGCTSDCCSYI